MSPHLPQNISLDKWDHSGMDGNVVFNYNTLQVSKDNTKKAKHLVDSTNTLNKTFLGFIQEVTTAKKTPGVRILYLNSFVAVVKGLRKSLAALEDSLKEEFSDLNLLCNWEKLFSNDIEFDEAAGDVELDISDGRCLQELQKLATEHLEDNDSDSKGYVHRPASRKSLEADLKEARCRAQKIGLNPPANQADVMKKLVVQLTPVAMEQEPWPHAPKSEEDFQKENKVKGKHVPEAEETSALSPKADSKISSDSSSAPLFLEEEQGNRRSPRVKTTPLRRPSDVKAKTPLSAGDSDSDSEAEGTPDTVTATNNREQNLIRERDDSDSDEVPAALLERAAMPQSSDEPQSDDERGQASPNKVAKKCLFWLTKNSPMSPEKMLRKRKMLDRSSESESSSRLIINTQQESETDSSSDEDSQKKIQHLSTVRSIGKPHLVKREEEGVARKQRRLQAGKSTAEPHQDISDSSSSFSDDDEDSGSDGSVQKMKPITENVSALGVAAFHQSSGLLFFQYVFSVVNSLVSFVPPKNKEVEHKA